MIDQHAEANQIPEIILKNLRVTQWRNEWKVELKTKYKQNIRTEQNMLKHVKIKN